MEILLSYKSALHFPEASPIPIASGENTPYTSIEDLWRRAGIPVSALERLADADAFGSLGLTRRDALWTIRGLSDEVMPLFAAADERDKLIRPRPPEPAVELTPMTEGREVVEDYRSKGLTLRQHPLAFLRARAPGAPDQQLRRPAAGPGRPAGHGCRPGAGAPEAGFGQGRDVHDHEDETDTANIIVWPSLVREAAPG
jgi:error-prone DNA polymerase